MLYDIAFLIFSVFYLPTLIFKGKLHKDFGERFGIYGKSKKAALSSGKKKIWIEAVSVGEVALCKSLIPGLKKRFPGEEIVLSTVTKTGNELAKKLFEKDAVIVYFPLDLSFIMNKAVRLINPNCYIMIETEIWPNAIKALNLRGVPLVLINGRISDRSIGKYRLAARFLKSTLERVKLFCMQSDIDKERIISLGASPERVRVTGNMKFDASAAGPSNAKDDVRKLLRIGEDEKLFVAGSIHEGEEQAVLDAFVELVKEFKNYRLLIAPRHIENFPYFEANINEREVAGAESRFRLKSVLMTDLRSKDAIVPKESVFLLNTIGQLKEIYALADIVYIGGSLVRRGGQNPLEAAAFGKPIIFGPYMFNFKSIESMMLKGGAAVRVQNGRELTAVVKRLAASEDEKITLGQNARNIVQKNVGATDRNLEAILEIMK